MEKKIENTVNQKSTLNKVISFIFGDTEKWKRLPEAFEGLKEDFKRPKEAAILIMIAVTCFALTFGTMQGIRWVQERAQYCDVIIKDASYRINELDPANRQYEIGGVNISSGYRPNYTQYIIDVESKKPTPPTGMNYRFYLDYWKDTGKSPWVGIECKFDWERFRREYI